MFARNNDYILRDISDISLLICSKRPINDVWIFEVNSIGRLIWENSILFNSFEELYESIQPFFLKELTVHQKEEVKRFVLRLIDMGLMKENV